MRLLNFLLALAWLALTGEFTLLNFLFGFAVAAAMIWIYQRVLPQEAQQGRDAQQRRATAYGLKAIQWISFGLYFIWALILANVRVAIDVLRPRPQIAPAVVAVPLDGYSDVEVTLLANFITLTPGTLSLDLLDRGDSSADEKQRVLYVHAMHAGETQEAIERFRDQLRETLGRRVKEVMQ